MMNDRRDWLKSAAALGLSSSLAPLTWAQNNTAAPTTTPIVRPWQNWSGIQSCQPKQWIIPGDEAELAKALASSTGTVRSLGASHSFMPLVPTDGNLVSLDRMSGIIAIDKANLRVRVQAGTRIGVLARALDAQGLALHNQPDIDTQALAGAFATGTHGTGANLQALHAHVEALRLVTPDGQVHECSADKNADLLAAAKVSLGSLGVISEYTLRVRPRFMLKRRVWLERTDTLIERAPELARQFEHFEMYVLPFTGYSAGITHAEVPAGAVDHPAGEDEDILEQLKRLRDWLGRWPEMRRWVAAKLIEKVSPEQAQDWSWRLLSTPRPTRFNETEYHLPRAQGQACLREIVQTLEQRNGIFFPIEFRFIKSDDAWLSPFYERDSNSVACHALQGEPYDYLINALGPVYHRHAGRPHWGKLNDMGEAQLQSLYPHFDDFQRLRRELDPQGRMVNPLLAKIFGGSSRG